MRIPETTIEEIRAASDVVDVVGEYVRLKQRGSNFFGLCPFHTERTASFSVNPKLGIYKCFGCGVGGDVFDFVMAIERSEFLDAARILAERAGITLPDEDESPVVSANEAVYHALRFAARFYYRQLTTEEGGNHALAYLKERGLSSAIIKHFGLGYAPGEWDALLRVAEGEHIEPQVLEQAGLIVPRRDRSGHYDRFRDRVIFPIISHVGKVLGFGGRTLTPSPDQPKYINSPETAVYHKGHVLFGLYQAKQAIRGLGEAILVEGYTDVISMHQGGVENVVASSGTALGQDQVQLLRRYAPRIVLLYDADAAGDAAMLRGMELLIQSGLAPHAAALPEGEDPDSFVRSVGGDGLRTYLRDHRQDFVSFQYGLAARTGMLETPDGQAEAVGRLLELILLLDDPVVQESYLQRASDVTGMPMSTLWRGLEQRRGRRRPGTRRASERASVPGFDRHEPASASATHPPMFVREQRSLPAEEALLRLMLEQGPWMIEFILSHMNLDEFSDGLPRKLVEAILTRYEEGTYDLQDLVGPGTEAGLRLYVANLLTDRDVPSLNWALKKNIPVPRLNEKTLEAAAGAMTQLKLIRVCAEIERLQYETLHAQQSGTDAQILQRKSVVLNDLRKQIEAREFIKWPEQSQESS